MRTFLGLIGWCLVVYGPWRVTTNPYTAFGRWCLASSGDWTYREERRMHRANQFDDNF